MVKIGFVLAKREFRLLEVYKYQARALFVEPKPGAGVFVK
jgi:hypothetical protein